MQKQENVVLLAVSGLVLGLFRGPLGSWVYGMAPLRPRLGVLIEKKFQMGISGRYHIFLPFWMQKQENVVLLAVSGLVLGLFRGPLGSWVYGLGPPRPVLGALM